MLFLLLIVPLIIFGVFAYFILTFNAFTKLRIRIKESWSQIDVQLKRRADLIPNLVETVKGYATHEKEVFENVTKARAAMLSAETVKQAQEAENMLSSTLKSLFAVAEAYPDLKAQDGFVNLQKELSDTEDKISYSRQLYNNVVRIYNEKVSVFPSNIVANMFKYEPQEFFEIQEAERESIKVDFNSNN